ncbi:MAG: hypothetical protein AAFT19_11725 [Pseudomonadota bacterium]
MGKTKNAQIIFHVFIIVSLGDADIGFEVQGHYGRAPHANSAIVTKWDGFFVKADITQSDCRKHGQPGDTIENNFRTLPRVSACRQRSGQ